MNYADISGVELTHLRYFVVLAEELHFSKAAARLNISQPPLTQQIQRLESRIGYPLFRRTSRRTELTEAGRVFYEAARVILQETHRSIELARRVARGESGEITLATPPSLMLSALPKAILKFRDRFPSVDVRLREMSTSKILEALQSGIADLGLVRGSSIPASLEKLASWKEAIVAILPSNHPLAKSRKFNLKLLAKEPFVFFPRDVGPAFYEELLDCCRVAGFEPRIVQEATQWSSVISLVSAGIGVSIGPASVSTLLKNSVVIRPVPRHRTEVHLVGSSYRENPVSRHFVEILRQAY